ncbi:MAG: hypothetical protein V2I43_23565 [Parvularcula sp.]|nr:hypothetical protein [Parvularcula sp.]
MAFAPRPAAKVALGVAVAADELRYRIGLHNGLWCGPGAAWSAVCGAPRGGLPRAKIRPGGGAA